VSPDNPAAAAVDRELWALIGELPADLRQAIVSRLLPHFTSSDRVDAPGNRDDRVSHEDFVRVAYDRVLARAADESGLRHYADSLAAGNTRANVVRALMLSPEFARRSARVPRDTQLCELANPAKWDNEEWVDIL